MSNYRALAWHPTKRRLEVATWADHGPGYYGYEVTFKDGVTVPENALWRPDEVCDPVDLFLIAQEMAEALEHFRDAADTLDPGDYELWEHAAAMCIKSDDIRRTITALAKWRDFTNAKEKK